MSERLTWEEMVEKYPDKWVFVKNAELDGIDIASGELICACTDKECGKKVSELVDAGVRFYHARTTHDIFGGFINAENVTVTIE